MIERLPENGASAVRLADPQAGSPAHVGRCANEKCQELLYAGEKLVHDTITDYLFCDWRCYNAWQMKHGGAEIVVLPRQVS